MRKLLGRERDVCWCLTAFEFEALGQRVDEDRLYPSAEGCVGGVCACVHVCVSPDSYLFTSSLHVVLCRYLVAKCLFGWVEPTVRRSSLAGFSFLDVLSVSWCVGFGVPPEADEISYLRYFSPFCSGILLLLAVFARPVNVDFLLFCLSKLAGRGTCRLGFPLPMRARKQGLVQHMLSCAGRKGGRGKIRWAGRYTSTSAPLNHSF